MVYRIFVEKKPGLNHESKKLLGEFRDILGIRGLEKVRLISRYDVENIDADLMEKCKKTVFSEPQQDTVSDELKTEAGEKIFAVEYLPGQFDLRADSAAQCVQIASAGERPLVRTARIYAVSGNISGEDLEAMKHYVINPVESREASMETFETLKENYEVPTEVETLGGFCRLNEAGLEEFVKNYSLAMDEADIRFCQDYFKSEHRDPTITEIRMIDTYWSDHCRHTTFLTTIDNVGFDDYPEAQDAFIKYIQDRKKLGRTKPVNLMDLATFGARLLKSEGKLPNLDESEEINACTVKMTIQVDGKDEDWLLLFKNETHNHPTEIEPFGGAATCIGGAIRDPLSGRAYVYSAMRVTGAANPLKPLSETLPGKLPQRKLVTTAAAGYSSYGNQIGLATGQVDEIYHEGYAAKRMEIGAVIGAVPAENVRREEPVPGDVVILLGGRTGRDGCGGATGSSKSHNADSLKVCGAEVQKGNAPVERKLQRLFRNREASLLIKRCNDFGAGGVSVAIGELADGLEIDLNRVPKKYEGLDGTELAISESQERMAVVVSREDAEKYIAFAGKENLEATPVAVVKAEKRLTMTWNGKTIVDLSREFLNSNGAEKHTNALIGKPEKAEVKKYAGFAEALKATASDLNVCSKRGLSEEFDSTIGAGTVLMPFGGKYELTPPQAMVNQVSVENGSTDACSFMAWGFNPFICEKDPFRGAYLSVVESLAKLAATGADMHECYLTFQEYFQRMDSDPATWGKPAAALLGALKAQEDFGFAAIGGKDSMSGSFENLHVPPTLVSFAVTKGVKSDAVSPEFKGAGHDVIFIRPLYDESGLVPVPKSEKMIYPYLENLIRTKRILSVYTPGEGGIAEAVLKMALGNGIGFRFGKISAEELTQYLYGSFIAELADGVKFEDVQAVPGKKIDIDESGAAEIPGGARVSLLGVTADDGCISAGIEEADGISQAVSLEELRTLWEDKLEPIFICNHVKGQEPETYEKIEYTQGTAQHASAPDAMTGAVNGRPHVLIPVFPGTNCEYDTMKAWKRAGAEPETFVVNNLTKESIAESVKVFSDKVRQSQIVFIPGGFSGGDEPDGSGKFITAFFRNPELSDAVMELLKKRDGLMAGICNGFQALVKLGLVPYGEIVESRDDDPTLTFNLIGRHQSRIVRTRIASNLSPWFAEIKVGDVYSVPVSHGEGRFVADEKWIGKLKAGGQIATQYVGLDGVPTSDIRFNPNGSTLAIEGITSPDGRVLGKMGHTERTGEGLYQNVPGNYNMDIFTSAVKYFG
ncbi:MAG: phosphoribosylformylglycinamidine synthase [Lachnospiraceae bacterium]|jgi:phosphoribosylformylglycinamidine synthase|nr:phosphoribosylformylglycinamidine synthase [Lachnospiraceae bacterium]MCI1726271.1 phosphoribosylformylglycinamidine synthase [Lachnospiraceae bacterium]